MHTHIYIYIYVRVQACIRINARTNTHTRAYIYTHTISSLWFCWLPTIRICQTPCFVSSYHLSTAFVWFNQRFVSFNQYFQGLSSNLLVKSHDFLLTSFGPVFFHAQTSTNIYKHWYTLQKLCVCVICVYVKYTYIYIVIYT